MRVKENDVKGTAAMMLSSRLSRGEHLLGLAELVTSQADIAKVVIPTIDQVREQRCRGGRAAAGRAGLAYSLILCRRRALRLWRPGSRAGSLVGSRLSPGCARSVLQRAWPPSAAVQGSRWAARIGGRRVRTCHQSFEQSIQAMGMRRAPVVAVGGAH